MARTATSRAEAVFAVGLPSLKGAHSLVRVVDGVLASGVAPDRVVPVFNRAPRSARARSGLTAAFADLVTPLVPAGELSGLASPVFLPERRIEECLRDGIRLPAVIAQPLSGALRAVTERAAAAAPGGAGAGPQPVRPGSLGRWTIEAAGS
jgi:hypothetical protein